MQAITQDSTQVLAGFRALADPLRLRIVNILRFQELCVCELCEKLDVSQSKLSFHLKHLKEASLVSSRQEGRWVYYSLNNFQFALLEQYLVKYRNLGVVIPAKNCE